MYVLSYVRASNRLEKEKLDNSFLGETKHMSRSKMQKYGENKYNHKVLYSGSGMIRQADLSNVLFKTWNHNTVDRL